MHKNEVFSENGGPAQISNETQFLLDKKPRFLFELGNSSTLKTAIFNQPNTSTRRHFPLAESQRRRQLSRVPD